MLASVSFRRPGRRSCTTIIFAHDPGVLSMSISSSPSARPADEPDWWMHGEVNLGIITALSIEFASMESLLIDVRQVHPEGDPNSYSVATLPSNDDDHPH